MRLGREVKRMFSGTLASLALGAAASAQPLPAHNWITPAERPTSQTGRTTFIDGNRLLDRCNKYEDACISYIQGVVDGQLAAIIATSRDVAYCIPTTANAGQVKDVVVKYLKDKPSERHLLAGVLVARALADAWPQCN